MSAKIPKSDSAGRGQSRGHIKSTVEGTVRDVLVQIKTDFDSISGITVSDASDLSTAVALVNDIKTKLNAINGNITT